MHMVGEHPLAMGNIVIIVYIAWKQDADPTRFRLLAQEQSMLY